tara:strand:- start:485 stop:1783 length:1299 start_codon:yes stop_codon:yes gene_type:complete
MNEDYINEIINTRIINRTIEEKKIENILNNFEENKNDLTIKRGIYVYGHPGTGKTTFVKDILKKLNYDIIYYDAGDIRNKTVIEEITCKNMGDINVLYSFQKIRKKLIIVMDEIDGMNNGDKGGINALIKLMRPKKTKKQKKESISKIPIICISDYQVDKKINELMKICELIEIKKPNNQQIKTLLLKGLPNLNLKYYQYIYNYLSGDLRKYYLLFKMYNKSPAKLEKFIQQNLLKNHIFNPDTKNITKRFIHNYYKVHEHSQEIKDTDRTIVSLLWHENIIDILNKVPNNDNIYLNILNNICFSDYIDRITFQKQIWQLSEISSIIKLISNNHLLHSNLTNPKQEINIRFTKVLTKYSTEYNNLQFIIQLCMALNKDKKDMLIFFIKKLENTSLESIYSDMENYDISKLDVDRIYRYINNISFTEEQILIH